MIVKTKIIMDLLKPTLCPVINAVQGDTYSRGIDISLFAAGVAWEIPDDVTAAVRYRKRDGTKGYYDTLPDGSAAWSAANNVLTVLLAPQMLTVAGPVVTQIEMIQGAKVLATFSMRLIVEENPAGEVFKSEDYINWLQWMKNELDDHLEGIRQFKAHVITLEVSNWENNTQTVSIAGVTADETKTDVLAAPDPEASNANEYAQKNVRISTQLDEAVIFECDNVPTIDLTVNVMVRV